MSHQNFGCSVPLCNCVQILYLNVHLLSAIPTFGPWMSLENRYFYLCSLTEVTDFIIFPLITPPLLFHRHQTLFSHNESLGYNPCKIKALSCFCLIRWHFINEENFCLTFPEIWVGFTKKTAKLLLCVFCWKQNKVSTFDKKCSETHLILHFKEHLHFSCLAFSEVGEILLQSVQDQLLGVLCWRGSSTSSQGATGLVGSLPGSLPAPTCSLIPRLVIAVTRPPLCSWLLRLTQFPVTAIAEQLLIY